MASDDAYNALKKCIYSVEDQKIKTQLIDSISQFVKEDQDLIDKFIQILKDNNESYSIQSSAAATIGTLVAKSKNIKEYVSMLKDIVKNNNSIFKEHVAVGAINGLGSLSDNQNKDILSDVIDFLIETAKYENGNTNLIRETSTSTLGNFVIQNVSDKKEVNYKVFKFLESALHDKWFGTRLSAIGGLLIPFSGENIIGLSSQDIENAFNMLEAVSKVDVHAEVRERANKAIKAIKDSTEDPLEIEITKSYLLKTMKRNRLFYKEW